MNVVFDSSQKDLRTMNSKRLAVFAASLQWADAVKVMSRTTPRSRTSVTWGIRWSVSAAENDGESGMHGVAQWPRCPAYYSTKVALMTVVRILTAYRTIQHPQFLMPLSYPIAMPAQFLLNIWPSPCFSSTARPVEDADAQAALPLRIIITLN